MFIDFVLKWYACSYNQLLRTTEVFGRKNVLLFFYPEETSVALNALWAFTQLLGLILLALIFVFVFSKSSDKIVKDAIERFWKNMIIGLAMFISVPVVIAVSFVTIIGIIPAIIVFLFYSALLFLSVIYGGIVFGVWVLELFTRAKQCELNWYAAVGGILALFIIGMIPGVGWMVYLFFTVISLGSLSSYYFKQFLKLKD